MESIVYMWDFLKHLKEFLSLNYRSLFILSGIYWILALLPTAFLETIGILNLWVQYRPWIIMFGVLFTAWLVIGGLYDITDLNKNKISNRMESKKKQEKLLLSTSRVEKEVLSRYLIQDTTTVAFDYRDGVVNGLIAKGILYRASQASNPMSFNFDINIQTWSWDYLQKHPEILEGIEPNDTGRHQFRLR
jgi:Super-infection exclusion protein B